MATHGSEKQVRDHDAYVRSEIMSLGEQIRRVEGLLNSTSRRLDWVEAQLTGRPVTSQSVPDDHVGG